MSAVNPTGGVELPEPFERPVLVWGACGFIGSHLVARLLREGARVSVLTYDRRRYPVPAWADEVQWFELRNTVADDAILAEAVESSGLIYNLAGTSGAVASNREPLASLDSICRTQLRMLGAAQAAGHRPHVVFASSRLVYGQPDALPVAETAALAPASMYAAHKLCVENYHRIYSGQDVITATILRITNPFGADLSAKRKPYGFINNLIHQGLDGQPMTIYGNGQQLRDYLHIDDLVEAMVLAGTRREACNETFNIGSGAGVSIHEAAILIQRLTESGAVQFVQWPAEYVLVESGSFVADIGRAGRLLGFKPGISFEEGLVRTVQAEMSRRRAACVNSNPERRRRESGLPRAAAGGERASD